MRVCIHRGTKQIGGTCVEMQRRREAGSLLISACRSTRLKPTSPSFRRFLACGNTILRCSIVLSHGHRDHWGLVPKVRPDIPIVMGEAAEHIMRAAARLVPDAFAPKAWKYLESGKPLQIGPFAVTPHLVDHSGFDAYALRSKRAGGACSIPATCVLTAERASCLNEC